MAECHPVAFQWVMEAKARGATVIHVDPRFTRTSAVSDLYLPIRAGADIAFVGGLINYVLSSGKYFKDYVLAYTNAATILTEDYADTEDLDGVFSGLNREHRYYDFDTWRYQGEDVVKPASGERLDPEAQRRIRRAAAAGRTRRSARLRRRRRLPHRGHRRHAAASALRVPGAEAALRPLHPGDGRAGLRRPPRPVRPGVRAGHGQLRPRPHDRVRLQPRLDSAHRRRAVHPHRGDPAGAARQHGPARRRDPGPARPRLHPGVHGHPDPVRPAARLPADAVRGRQRGPRRLRAGRVRAERILGEHPRVPGQPAEGVVGRGRDGRERLLLRLPAAADRQPQHLRDGPGAAGRHLQGLLPVRPEPGGRLGQRPDAAAGHGQAGLAGGPGHGDDRERHLVEGRPGDRDRRAAPEDIGTEVFFLPAAAHTEKSGSFTNTQRLLQWHHQAVEPAGDARSDLWFTYHLGRRIRAKLAALRPTRRTGRCWT